MQGSIASTLGLLTCCGFAACSADTEALPLAGTPNPTPSPTPSPSPTGTCTFDEPLPFPEASYDYPPFVLDGDEIYAAVTLPSHVERDVIRVRSDDVMEPILVYPDRQDEGLLSVQDGRALIAGGEEVKLVYPGRDSVQGTLHAWARRPGEYRRRNFGDGFIAWLDQGRGQIFRVSTTSFGPEQPISGAPETLLDLDVSGPTLAYVTGAGAIVIQRGDARFTVNDGPLLVQAAHVVGDAVFWVTQAGLRRWSNGTVETALAMRCTLLAVHGDALAAVCDGTGRGGLSGDVVAVFDGTAQAVLTDVVRGGEIVTAIDISDNAIAWTIHDPSVSCGSSGPAAGRLEVHARRAEVVEVTSILSEVIGGPCWCCDALWPNPYIALSGGLVAWSYPSLAPFQRNQFAYARVTGCRL